MSLNYGDVDELLYGVGRLYFTEAINDGDDPFDMLPDDDVEIGEDWGTVGSYVWSFAGFTQDGLHVLHSATNNPIRVDQLTRAAKHIRTETDDRIRTTLAQATLENIKRATGRGTITNLAPVDSTPGPAARGWKRLRMTSDTRVEYIGVGVEGIAPPDVDYVPRRIVCGKVMAVGSVDNGIMLTDISKIALELAAVGGGEGDVLYHDVIEALP